MNRRIRVVCLLGGGGALFAVAVILFVAYAYPGYMSFDSGWQLREARAGEFSDWHPPAMAELWRVCDWLVRGPALMLLSQAGSYATGIILLVRKRRPTWAALIAAGALLVFPPIATTLAVIWKDSQMLGYLVLGTALLAPPANAGARLAGLGMLALASAMRHNAFTITLAIIVLLFEVPAATRVRRYVIATAIWAVITVAAFGINTLLTDKPMHPWHGSLAVFDVLGTLHYARPLTDDEIRDTLRGTHFEDAPPLQKRVDRAYDPFDGIFRDFQVHFIYQPADASERAAMARAFRTAVERHPLAYLRHRLRAFREVLQLPPRRFGRVWIGYDLSTGYSHATGSVQRVLQHAALWIGDTWLFWPFLYLFASCVFLVIAIRRRDRLVVALGASAVISECSLFFLAPTPDFRYSIWVVLVAVLSPWLLARSPPDRQAHRATMLAASADAALHRARDA